MSGPFLSVGMSNAALSGRAVPIPAAFPSSGRTALCWEQPQELPWGQLQSPLGLGMGMMEMMVMEVEMEVEMEMMVMVMEMMEVEMEMMEVETRAEQMAG